MNTLRAFIAVEIDNLTKQKISKLISDLKKSNTDAKWITENQMHLTLKFLGNIDENKVGDISNALSEITDNFSAFAINLSSLGAFPGMNHPRVVWLGVNKGAGSLIKLNEKIETAMEKTGFKKESRKFEPHLTLARIRTSKNISNLIKLINGASFPAQNDAQIDKLVLFQSTLTPKGALYKIILEKNLRKV